MKTVRAVAACSVSECVCVSTAARQLQDHRVNIELMNYLTISETERSNDKEQREHDGGRSQVHSRDVEGHGV